MTDIPFDIASLHRAYAAGLAPAEIVEIVFRRIDAAGDPGIFIHLADRAAVLAEADALGAFDLAAKPLWGIPFAVKDNIDVAGMPTTAACPEFSYLAEADAAVVALLRAAGALVIGKTNLDQFATGLVGLRTPYPAPLNAVHPKLVPGGSSSGSAVAVARGIVSFALGTDTAGSGRVPAGLNAIVGLKPSRGAISTAGVVPACRSLDCVSIFALGVEDAYAVYRLAVGLDGDDAYSRAITVPPLAARPPVLTVGVPAASDRRFFGDTAMERGFDAALDALRALGCRIVELPFADFHAAGDLLYEGAWVAERYAAIEGFITGHEAVLHPVTAGIILGARGLSAADAFRGLYALEALKAKVAPLIASVDMLCVPTAPTHYSVEAVLADPIGTNTRLGTYTNFVNLLDLCGMAVPAGRRADGLPMSVTLLAPAGEDMPVAALGRDLAVHFGGTVGATGWPVPPPSVLPEADADEVRLVVVGAHLSGMPLNGELTRLDARFERAGRTAPKYRLLALAGQSVPKPGLERLADGQGVAIDIEIWRLSVEAFGRFVASVPPPMTIGSVELDDGTLCKGFLVEPAGTAGARDISAMGGWRRFVERA